MPGQQFEYGFDDIGNRTTVKSGGDSEGGTLRQSQYVPNLRNQYTSRTVPDSLDVIGLANANATVTVNGQTPYRHGEYFQASVPVGNCPDAVQCPEITVTATRSGYSTEQETGHIFVPGCAEAFEYDADGNLLHDDRWDYTWDAENRLVRMVARTTTGPQQWIEFQYDWRGRRVAKTVWANVQRTDPPAVSLKFLYDGWNLLAEIDAMQTPATVTRHYVWGLDLSGSLAGAGGVGGLLAVYSTLNAQPSTHFAAYDGNGNVMALVDGATGRASAEYLYGPFGELLARSGAMAEVNPIRFSSKYQDTESGLCYYGHRYYDPSTGRWLSRDPIGEGGGQNLYEFARNNALEFIDHWGLCTPGCHRAACEIRVVPAGRSPETKKQIEELAALYTQTEWFGMVLASGETAAAGLAGIGEAVATGIGKAVDHGLTTPGRAIEKTAKALLERLGDRQGWTVWIRVYYQACLKRCWLGRWWTGEDGYWKYLAGSSKEWEQVKSGTPITEGYFDPREAFRDGLKQCQEKTARFRKANKMCD